VTHVTPTLNSSGGLATFVAIRRVSWEGKC
jgi:hypothetical protein